MSSICIYCLCLRRIAPPIKNIYCTFSTISDISCLMLTYMYAFLFLQM